MAVGKPFTPKQQRIWDMKQAGKTRPQIAAELGISVPVVGKQIAACYKKQGIVKKPGDSGEGGRRVEHQNPEKAAALIDAITEPEALQKVSDAMKAAGMPERVRTEMVRRLKVKYFGAVTEIRNLKTSEILDMLGKRIHLAMTYMDDKVMAEASFRDLALGTTAMIEKRNLLRGEPTQIVSDHERKKLHELLPALIEEGKRRGITVEGQVTEKVVNPV